MKCYVSTFQFGSHFSKGSQSNFVWQRTKGISLINPITLPTTTTTWLKRRRRRRKKMSINAIQCSAVQCNARCSSLLFPYSPTFKKSWTIDQFEKKGTLEKRRRRKVLFCRQKVALISDRRTQNNLKGSFSLNCSERTRTFFPGRKNRFSKLDQWYQSTNSRC